MKRLKQLLTIGIICIACCSLLTSCSMLGGSIKGTVVLHQGNDQQTYSFSGPGEYGGFTFVVGPDHLPIRIELFNRNDWHIINMSFDVEVLEDAYHITGIIDVKTYPQHTYDKTIPKGEPISISVDCFP